MSIRERGRRAGARWSATVFVFGACWLTSPSGASAVPIDSRVEWNPTGIEVVAGREYLVSASGAWTDWFNRADARGYDDPLLKVFTGFRRAPDSLWFSLMCAVAHRPTPTAQDPLVDIGAILEDGNGRFTAVASGTLFCFANDAPLMTWNNEGTIELTVSPAP